ncbi:MAG: 30S ribosomal protein S2 [Parcubacteria group bacterium]|jgi:small subunit ribosomal protein S2
MKKEENKPNTGSTSENSQVSGADFMYEDLKLSVEEMLKRGVHFGHKKSRWNPKMEKYIFGSRNDIHIIDLEKTEGLFREALNYIRGLVQNGGKIMIVGTKPQAQRLVETAAREAEMPFVSKRWLGGTLTNFPEIKKRIKYLNEQEKKMAQGELDKYTKYEQSQMKKEMERMNEKIGGIKKIDNHPQALFVIDIKENNLAVKEAKKAKVPVVGIVDTNTDPTQVDFPIPANDDALSSLKYILGLIVKNIKEAKSEIKKSPEKSVNVKPQAEKSR